MLRKKIIGGMLLAPLAFMLVSFDVAALESFNGVIFNDTNLNGAKESGEVGIEGLTVSIYDNNGLVASTTTDSGGLYNINVQDGLYRIQVDNYAEFGYWPTSDTGQESTVRFVSTSATEQNFGLHIPKHFCEDNPDIAITCFVTGKQIEDGRLISDPALVDIAGGAGDNSLDPTLETIQNYSSPKEHDLMVPASEIGSTYGLAHDPTSDSIYASSFMKRHAGFGPGGTGAIYQVDRSTGTASVLATLDAGLDPHPSSQFENNNDLCLVEGFGSFSPVSTEDCWLHDPYSFDQVGFIGLGDLELSEDLSTLYTINLADKALYTLDVVTGDIMGSVAVPNDCSSEAVPFGIGVNQGSLYVGVVCTDASSAQVYKYNMQSETFEAAPVLRFGLSYERGNTANWFVPPMSANWNGWVDSWDEVLIELAQGNDQDVSVASMPQPILSDIEFDSAGNMILGLRDRFGDQSGHAFSTDTSDGTIFESEAAGDSLRACVDGVTWVIEGSSESCPSNTGLDGTREFFNGDSYVDGEGRVTHAELSLGSLAYNQTTGSVLAGTYNPIPFYYDDGDTDTYRDQGLRWHDSRTGAWEKSYRLVDGDRSFDYFDKANGLGDLELICEAAPIEIGNRVWFDSDRDGVQDPTDPALRDIVVELVDENGVVVGTATTDENGYYVFSSAKGTDTQSAQYNLNLQYRTNYTLQIDTTQAALNGYAPTLTTIGDDGEIDSDGVPSGSFVSAIFTTGGSGNNDHSFDFGFVTGAFGSTGPIVDPETGEEILCDDILEDAFNSEATNLPEVCLPFGASGPEQPLASTQNNESLIRTGGR